MKKIAIIGAGSVGETTAQQIAAQQLCESLYLMDVRADYAKGVALDLAQTAACLGFDVDISGGSDPAGLADSDLVVVTAGIARKPGMSRSDVLDANLSVIDSIAQSLLDHAPDTRVLVVSNPVDILTWRLWKKTGWSRDRVFGQAGVLDASRMALFIAEETGFSQQDITTMVMGGHGDTMVPLPRFCTVNGVPVSQFISQQRLEEIFERTRFGGGEVLNLRGNSSAYDAPGVAVAAMVDAMSRNRKRLIPCVVPLEGEYGVSDVAIGVPCVLGEGGVEKVIELDLNQSETDMLHTSINHVKSKLPA